MLRIALTAYFCLASVVGPGFCCCAVKQISSGSAMQHHSCCNRRSGTNSERVSQLGSKHRDTAEREHSSNRGAQVLAGHRSAKSLASSEPIASKVPRSPRGDDKHSCPCSQQHLKSVPANAVKANVSVNSIGSAVDFQRCATPPQSVADVIDLSTRSKDQFVSGPPAEPAGRELLCAFQILLC